MMALPQHLPDQPGNVLCVANFRTNAGYAWDFIESLYAAVADDLAPFGVHTWVSYPRIDAPPASLAGSAAKPLALDVPLGSLRGLLRAARVMRRARIRTLYLSDRDPWHPAYALLRLAGVRRIVVHDHTSGERTPPAGLKRLAKRASRLFRPAMADVVLAVSDYVQRRKLEIDLIPAERVRTMFNSVVVPDVVNRSALRAFVPASDDRPLIVCACRAASYKGVQVLLQAFDLLAARVDSKPMLVYFGDGPYAQELNRIRGTLSARDDVVFAGYHANAADFMGGADLCVVPSVWGEAFGLAALEPGARGVAVIASRVGGIPEVVDDGRTGLLVTAGDVEELARAMESLLADPGRRRAMGASARARARALFSRERQLADLTRLFRQLTGVPLDRPVIVDQLVSATSAAGRSAPLTRSS